MINTDSWADFRVGDLFDIHPTKAYKMTNSQILDGGETPVVANSAYNNGIGGYSSLEATEKGNMITFSDTVDANTIFYQPEDFVGYPHVQGLYPIRFEDKWNQYTYQFFASIFRKSALTKGFDYGNKFRRDIAVDLMIKLPVTSDGNPDWNYMESYMKNVIEESEEKISNISSLKSNYNVINIQNWGRFHLYDEYLFDIDMGSKLDKVKMTENNPTINFVGRANTNNGITTCIDEIDGLKPYEAGYMTLSLGGEYLGSCFIQPKPFYTSQNVIVLIPKNNMTDNVKRFISTMIFKEGRTHYKAFVDELNRHIKTDFQISLPVTSDGAPDWNYMDSYMEKINKDSDYIINTLNNIAN